MSGRGDADSALPNLIVIGAMKCGTSALHYYLGMHPEVQMSRPKELDFFITENDFDPAPYAGDSQSAHLLRNAANWSQGADWYAGHFSASFPVRGESSISYTFPWYRGTAERMTATVPDARLIFMVRHPIERIVSHYLQFHSRDRRPLSAAVADTGSPYLALSRYASILEPYLERFDRDRILIIRQEDLLAERPETMAEVFSFLGVASDFWSPKMESLRNRSEGKGRMYRLAERVRTRSTALRRLASPVTARLERLLSASAKSRARPSLDHAQAREVLAELEEDIARLERLTGWDLNTWRRPPL